METIIKPYPLQSQLLLILLASVVVASATVLPVPPPVHCGASECTVSTFQHQWADSSTPCRAAMAFYPTSEEELLRAVAYAAKTQTKVKVVSKEAHSFLKLICPGGDDGLVISTRDYNSRIIVNVTQMTVTADAGVMLRDLVDTIAKFGLTLPHTPIWDAVSVAGMISTGSHGSSFWGNGSCPHDRVIGIRLITAAPEEEGYVKIKDLTSEDEDLNAAKVSLGVLGVISQVTFQLESMFKRSVAFNIRGDNNLESEILDFAKQHEFATAYWYPSSGKTLFRLDDRVSVEEEGDGAMKDPFLDQIEVQVIENLASNWKASNTRDKIGEVCMQGEAILNHRFQTGDGYVNSRDNIFTGYPVVGYNNLMQTGGGCGREAAPRVPTAMSSGMVELISDDVVGPDAMHDLYYNMYNMPVESKKLSTCVWNPLVKGLSFNYISIAVPASRIGEAIAEVKKLREADPQALCGLAQFGGIWMRFLGASEAYLGEREDAVVWEMIIGMSKEPLPYAGAMQEVEQMLLGRYGGKPHWGKNRQLAFEGMAGKTRDMSRFLAARQRLDPLGLFSNEWSDAVLGISTTTDRDSDSSLSSTSSSASSSASQSVQTLRDGCALDGLCVCRDDSHCLPAKGFFCRPGLVYKEARVCRYEEEDNHAAPIQ